MQPLAAACGGVRRRAVFNQGVFVGFAAIHPILLGRVAWVKHYNLMAKQMYVTVLVVANLEAKPLPATLLNALEEEAHNLAEARERNICDAMKTKANLSVRWVELVHHKLDVSPLVA